MRPRIAGKESFMFIASPYNVRSNLSHQRRTVCRIVENVKSVSWKGGYSFGTSGDCEEEMGRTPSRSNFNFPTASPGPII
jgi:hypothetical protein